MLPNFLVIGAQKAGSTTLCDLIAEHPDVFLCTPKEPHFFSRDAVYERGLPWYEGLFESAAGKPCIGDGSTTYSMQHTYPEAANRIRQHLGSPKLIYVLRNPVERVRSHWAHDWSMGRDLPRSLASAVREAPKLIDNSLYWAQLERYRAYVPDERIHVLLFEDFLAEPEAQLRRTFEFLGVDPAPAGRIDLVNRNPTVAPGLTRWLRSHLPGYSRLRSRIPAATLSPLKRLFKRWNRPAAMDTSTRDWIRDRVRGDARELMRHLGRTDDPWKLETGSPSR